MVPQPIVLEKATDHRNSPTAAALGPLRASHPLKGRWALCAHQSVEPLAPFLHPPSALALRYALALREIAIEEPHLRVTQSQALEHRPIREAVSRNLSNP